MTYSKVMLRNLFYLLSEENVFEQYKYINALHLLVNDRSWKQENITLRFF